MTHSSRTKQKTCRSLKAQVNSKPASTLNRQKSGKSMRGRPELYDELKKPYSIGVTPTGIKGLDALSRAFNLSRSEFIEQIGRGYLKVIPADVPATPQEQMLEKGVQNALESGFLSS
jgi:hypothetical protein